MTRTTVRRYGYRFIFVSITAERGGAQPRAARDRGFDLALCFARLAAPAFRGSSRCS
jgi:hypothetical protein